VATTLANAAPIYLNISCSILLLHINKIPKVLDDTARTELFTHIYMFLVKAKAWAPSGDRPNPNRSKVRNEEYLQHDFSAKNHSLRFTNENFLLN